MNALKATPRFDSNPTRENCMLHGEIAIRKLERRASEFFLNNSLTRKKVVSTVSIPKIADGNRTANVLTPNRISDGITAYA